jgi:hypothetical protein
MTTTLSPDAVREPSFVDFGSASGRALARAQNFLVEWIGGNSRAAASSPREMLLLLPDAGATIRHAGGATEVPARSICILPAGSYDIAMGAAGAGVLIAHRRDDAAGGQAINQSAYAQPDPRIAPADSAYARAKPIDGIEIIDIDATAAPADNPRLKMFQTDTLSINWVEYDGLRDRTKLSPHSHDNFEQGSLAIHGEFVHHLRVPWTGNATLWRDDVHLRAGPASLTVVPVKLIHTSEGSNEGRHLLIDVFSPPRRDFIAKGWVANSADYREQA